MRVNSGSAGKPEHSGGETQMSTNSPCPEVRIPRRSVWQGVPRRAGPGVPINRLLPGLSGGRWKLSTRLWLKASGDLRSQSEIIKGVLQASKISRDLMLRSTSVQDSSFFAYLGTFSLQVGEGDEHLLLHPLRRPMVLQRRCKSGHSTQGTPQWRKSETWKRKSTRV